MLGFDRHPRFAGFPFGRVLREFPSVFTALYFWFVLFLLLCGRSRERMTRQPPLFFFCGRPKVIRRNGLFPTRAMGRRSGIFYGKS